MAETFEIGDAVEYEDAYTGELKRGRMHPAWPAETS